MAETVLERFARSRRFEKNLIGDTAEDSFDRCPLLGGCAIGKTAVRSAAPLFR